MPTFILVFSCNDVVAVKAKNVAEAERLGDLHARAWGKPAPSVYELHEYLARRRSGRVC